MRVSSLIELKRVCVTLSIFFAEFHEFLDSKFAILRPPTAVIQHLRQPDASSRAVAENDYNGRINKHKRTAVP